MKYAPYKKSAPSKFKTYFLRGLLCFAILLLLLIPTYVAVAAYVVQKNAPVDNVQTVYEKMQLTGPSNVTMSASATENTALFSIFTALCESGNEVISVPDTHRNGHYVALMQTQGVSDRFDFYFLPTQDTCYYTTPDGRIFRSRHALTTEFLNGSYAFELYENASLPVLTTAATDEVLPFSVSWHYRTGNGQFTERVQSNASWQLHTYPIANDIAFYFSIPPSSHEIVISRDGDELYRGNSEGISLPLLDDEILDFEIQAAYDPDSQSDYYGEIRYRFRMQVVEAAHFSLNTDALQVGEILLLTCENVKNAQKLQITAQPALAVKPILFERGAYVYAAIPAPLAGEYDLRVTYGTVSGSFTVRIAPITAPGTPDTENLNGDWITLLTHKLPQMIQANGAEQDSSLTPHAALAWPEGEKILGFGDLLQVPDTESTPALPFDLYRIDSVVSALAAGRVLTVGSDLHLGKYVIVDHGCGLYTWYAGLSELRVSAGDILAVGDVVGLPSTVLHREQSALLMATLGKAPVAIDPLCGTPVTLPE